MGDYSSSDDECDCRPWEYYSGQRFYIMYHGTTLSAALKIIRHGFKPSTDGMLGPGIYVSRSLDKAKRYPLNPEPRQILAVLKLRVRVGKVKKIDRQGHPLQKTWYEEGYDTAWVPPNCGMVKSGLEEDCVWDPSRIEVLEMQEVHRNDDYSDEDEEGNEIADDEDDGDNYDYGNEIADDEDDGDNYVYGNERADDEDGGGSRDVGEGSDSVDKCNDNDDNCCKCRIL